MYWQARSRKRLTDADTSVLLCMWQPGTASWCWGHCCSHLPFLPLLKSSLANLPVLRHTAQCSFPSSFFFSESQYFWNTSHITKCCAGAFPYILYFIMYTAFGLKNILFYWCGNKDPELPSPWLYRNEWEVPGFSPSVSDSRCHVPSFIPCSLTGLCLIVALLFLSVCHPCPASQAVSLPKTQMGGESLK